MDLQGELLYEMSRMQFQRLIHVSLAHIRFVAHVDIILFPGLQRERLAILNSKPIGIAAPI